MMIKSGLSFAARRRNVVAESKSWNRADLGFDLARRGKIAKRLAKFDHDLGDVGRSGSELVTQAPASSVVRMIVRKTCTQGQ